MLLHQEKSNKQFKIYNDVIFNDNVSTCISWKLIILFLEK